MHVVQKQSLSGGATSSQQQATPSSSEVRQDKTSTQDVQGTSGETTSSVASGESTPAVEQPGASGDQPSVPLENKVERYCNVI